MYVSLPLPIVAMTRNVQSRRSSLMQTFPDVFRVLDYSIRVKICLGVSAIVAGSIRMSLAGEFSTLSLQTLSTLSREFSNPSD